MPYVSVDLGKRVQPAQLRKILVDAAKGVGYRADVIDGMREIYVLGSVQRVQEPTGHTRVRLRKSFIPLGEVGFSNERSNDSISVFYGLGFGFSGRGTVERYLNAVSKLLETL